MEVKKFKLFEADIKSNKAVPSNYIEDVEKKANDSYGTRGPSQREMREGFEIMMQVQRIQHGNESKLDEIGKQIIQKYYGEIINDVVDLDIKIVSPDDEEKREMTDKMVKNSKESKKQEQSYNKQQYQEQSPVDYTGEPPVEEIDKRKILNNMMQGESQNVQSMMFSAKSELDKIDPNLLNLYTRGFDINKKFDWMDGIDLEQMMNEHPEMANAMEVKYPENKDTSSQNDDDEDEGGEEGMEEEKPTIVARVLDLPMLIHETVKGIYELIMAHAIPDDSELAKKILSKTDTLKDEQQDVKYGPYIASDIRSYFNDLLVRTTDEKTIMIPNIREFIYAELAGLDAKIFVELIRFILLDDKRNADIIVKNQGLVKKAISNILGDEPSYTDSYENTDDHVQKYDEFDDDGYAQPAGDKDEVEDWKKPKTYAQMSQSQLMKLVDDALDEEDYATVKEIQPFLDKPTNENLKDIKMSITDKFDDIKDDISDSAKKWVMKYTEKYKQLLKKDDIHSNQELTKSEESFMDRYEWFMSKLNKDDTIYNTHYKKRRKKLEKGDEDARRDARRNTRKENK